MEAELIDACQEIGGIAESNNGYTAMLTRAIEHMGVTVKELTVAELLQVHRDTDKLYNKIHKAE